MSRILIVEDDHWLAEGYQVALSQTHQTIVASTAVVAIEQFDQFKPDLVLLDIMLPEANGLQFIHEIRSHEDSKDLPIIVISDAIDGLTTQQQDAYGITAVISKQQLTSQLLRQQVDEVVGV